MILKLSSLIRVVHDMSAAADKFELTPEETDIKFEEDKKGVVVRVTMSFRGLTLSGDVQDS